MVTAGLIRGDKNRVFSEERERGHTTKNTGGNKEKLFVFLFAMVMVIRSS